MILPVPLVTLLSPLLPIDGKIEGMKQKNKQIDITVAHTSFRRVGCLRKIKYLNKKMLKWYLFNLWIYGGNF